MARKHQARVPESEGALILPAELLRQGGLDRSESTTMHKERRQWFLDRQIDPGDWSQVHPILLASGRAHGIPYCALDRAWVRSVGLDEWQRIHQGRSEVHHGLPDSSALARARRRHAGDPEDAA